METIQIGSKVGKAKVDVGKGLETKINLIVGANYDDEKTINEEIKKIEIGAELGVHTIIDLSLARLKYPLWHYVRDHHPDIACGTVPPYHVYIENNENIPPKKLMREIQSLVEQGVDYMTLNMFPENAGDLELLENRGIKITSRQGRMIAEHMKKNSARNPYHEMLDEMLDLFERYNVTIHIGTTFRPAGITDAYDKAHNWETEKQMEMHQIMDENNVQSIVEIMSHQRVNEIRPGMMKLREQYGQYVPFQMLGPVVTDIAEENDHIAASNGAMEAARYNVGKVTVIPPYEHIRLPTPEDVRLGIKAAKIGVHSGDMARLQNLDEQDRKVLENRARAKNCNPNAEKAGCNKCGVYCPLL